MDLVLRAPNHLQVMDQLLADLFHEHWTLSRFLPVDRGVPLPLCPLFSFFPQLARTSGPFPGGFS